MADLKLKKNIQSTFKLNGYNLRNDVCVQLLELLRPVEESEREEWLEKFLEHIRGQALPNAVVEKSHIDLAIQECIRSESDETDLILNVIDAFDVPRFMYNVERKKFEMLPASSPTPCLFDAAQAKTDLFKNRYTILRQRTLRHSVFTPALPGEDKEEAVQKFNLPMIEYLLSSSVRLKDIIVLGLLTQMKEGRFYLEDPTGSVRLDLTGTKFHSGLHTENCFVLAEGVYDDKVFHAKAIGFPPAESSETSRAYFGNLNVFGGPSPTNIKSSSKLFKIEQTNEDGIIVFLSDVWLDQIKVLQKLKVLFRGYSHFPPIAFVLMGNFLSTQHRSTYAHTLKSCLKDLADIIVEYPPILQNSRFIFVPGPIDPASANILPRTPLPRFVIKEFSEKIPSAIFASNPCRIQYCTKEIIVLRHDMVTKLCRNTIHFPSSGEIPDHFAKTIICQATLSPIPLTVCPIYWSFDNALSLYPLPDVVVVADNFSSFTASFMGCQVVNPGSFPKSEFSFKAYCPASNLIEDSQIPNE
ncbi:DNA polymerase epsilon subunit 2 isoform X1 [Ischnura elegans]|uniref:DNA polymerase epsilon subunit 2 isoform X1 n=2 Tax=Ischnura elegans TaxID=197161 RepID=UPI001ED87F39|nr:DNA polymerase epsilon subunit 2 isoform X1 [Ischnura elegans]